MTGYSALELAANSKVIIFELRSINSRFLDINFKLSEDVKPYEQAMRSILTKYIVRGKVDCKVYTRPIESLTANIELKPLGLIAFNLMFENIKQVIPSLANPTLKEVLDFPGNTHKTEEVAITQQTILDNFMKVVESLNNSLQQEGQLIKETLQSKIEQIEQLVAKQKYDLPYIMTSYQNRTISGLHKLLRDCCVDDNRINQEIAFIAQKYDVMEELDRLDSHTAQFTNKLQQTETRNIGKHLDFITQEMHREANTLGAKAVSMDTTNTSINIKLLVEQVREQVQNIA